MKKCPFCEKQFKSNSSHIYACSNLEDKKEIKYKYIQYNFPEISNKEVLLEVYQKNKNSLPDIRKKYGIDFKSVIFLLDYFEIKKRTSSESAKKISVPKQKKTIKSKYGVDWSSNLPHVKELKRKNCIQKYGVDNVFKSDWFKENREYFFLEKHGMDISDFYKIKWDEMSDEEKKNHMLNSTLKSSQNSSIEKRIKDILDIMNIEYSSQFSLTVGKNIKFFDIKIGNILIEVNGDFWHGNPLKYKKNDILKFPKKEVICESLWIKDKKKKEIALKKGYIVVYLWESFIRASSDDDIINELKKIIIDKDFTDRNHDKRN
jgi:hypothetical protein